MSSQVVGVLRAILTADTSEYDTAMRAAGQSTAKMADALEQQLAPRLSTVSGLVKGMIGTSDIRRAEEYALAVEKVGGVAKLTASDQAKVNKVLGEALDHYRVLGTEAPAHLSKLKTELDATAAAAKKLASTSAESGSLASSFATLTAAFAGGSIVDRVTSGLFDLGKAAIADAGHLVDLSEKTGLSIEALQVYGEVAKESGSDIDAVSDAVFKLGVNISTGSTSTRDAIADLGLAYKDIKNLAPEQQFELIAQKLHDISDVQERNRIGVALMGKGYKDVAAGIAEGLDTIRDKTVIVSEAQAKAIDAMADAWDRFWANAVKTAEASAGRIVLAIEREADAAARMEEKRAKSGIGTLGFYGITANPTIPGGAGNLAGPLGGTVNGRALTADQLAAAQAAFQKQQQMGALGGGLVIPAINLPGMVGKGATGDYTAELAAATAALNALSAAQIKNIADGLALNHSVTDIANSMGIAADVIEVYKDRVKAAAEADRQHTAVVKAKNAEFDKLVTVGLPEKWAKTLPGEMQNPFGIWQTKADQELNNILAKRLDVSKLPGDDTKAFFKTAHDKYAAGEGTIILPQKGFDLSKGTITDQLIAAQNAAHPSAATAIGSRLVGAGGVAMQAITGGGSVSGALSTYGVSEGLKSATGGLVKSLTTDAVTGLAKTGIGAAIGSLIGGAIPFVGGLIGPLIGKLMGPSAGQKANTARDAVKAQLGGDTSGAGLETLVGKYKETAAVQSAYQDFLAAKTEDTVNKSAQALQAAMNAATTDVEAKAARMADALGKVSGATAKVATGFSAKLAPALAEIAKARDAQQQAAESGDTDAAAAAGTHALELQKSAVHDNQAEFDRLNRITLASFNAFIAQGKSAIDAVQAVGPAIDSLKGQADAFGFAGSAAFDQLSRWRDLTSQNAPLLDQVSGLNDLMSALSTLGSLDAGTFADLQAQGVSAFDAMTKAGFSQQEAETQLAPLLQNVIDMHDKSGLAIDDETQKLIDQAREDGTLKEKQISDQQVMIEGFSALIKAVGGDVPAAFTKMAKSSTEAAKSVSDDAIKASKGVIDAFKDVTVTIPVTYTSGGVPGPVVNPDDLPQHATGGIATHPTVGVFGEAGPEALIPLNRSDLFGPRTIVLETDGRAWARVHAPYVATEVQRLQLTR